MLQVAKSTLGEQFGHAPFSSWTQWTITAEISAPTNYVVWMEHMILLSTALPQSSPWRFDKNQVTQKNIVYEYFWLLHGGKYPEKYQGYFQV